LALFFSAEQWDDALNGAPRYALPLTLAFNVITPRGRPWLPVLLTGNLTVLLAPTVLATLPPYDETPSVDGISCDFVSGWYAPEHKAASAWRWADGEGVLELHNSRSRVITVNLDFDMTSPTARTVVVSADASRESVDLKPFEGVHRNFGPIDLRPGDTRVTFETSEPAWTEPGAGGRELAYTIENLKVVAAKSPAARPQEP
jgi:hypothetical protein